MKEIAFDNISVLYALASDRKLHAFFRDMFELEERAAANDDLARLASA